MSDLKDSRNERIARYKEDRRKQLASQFASLAQPRDVVSRRRPVNASTTSTTSSSTPSPRENGNLDEPRTTRASRLRAAACTQESTNLFKSENEKSTTLSNSNAENRRISKNLEETRRKSNASNSPDISNAQQNKDVLPNKRRTSRVSQSDTSKPSPRKISSHSSLNSVKNITADTYKKNENLKEPVISGERVRKLNNVAQAGMFKHLKTNEKVKEQKLSNNSLVDNEQKLKNKEEVNKNRKISSVKNEIKVELPEERNPKAAKHTQSTNISRRMDELTILAQDALNRVEQLAFNKIKNYTKQNIRKKSSALSIPQSSKQSVSNSVDLDASFSGESHKTYSILKKKSLDETASINVVSVSSTTQPVTVPISILKRKVSQDEFHLQSTTSSNNTPPVTFSPSVIEPSTSRKKQGILKKRRSLDESQVLRHRSCSPEIASRSILKKKRRSSLENIGNRTQSPETSLHGILKRRPSRQEEHFDTATNSPEPQSILKRRSGSSSVGSTTNSPHISIATAVILAAAGGAEIVLDSNESVKPILKKRSSSDEQTNGEVLINEVPKPILKKKSSIDVEDFDDKPKKPILKNVRSLAEDKEPGQSDGNTECDVRPILKQTSSRDNSPRPRLSFCTNEEYLSISSAGTSRFKSPVICDLNIFREASSIVKTKPASVSDLVLNLERLSAGATAKASRSKRSSERYSTQPVTSQELQESLGLVEKSLQLDQSATSPSSLIAPVPESNSKNTHSLLDLTTSLETESIFNSSLSTSLPNTTIDSGVSIKMSSDSAFQSLGEGIELEKDEKPTQSISSIAKRGQGVMKALADEAKNAILKKRESAGFKLNKKSDDGVQGSSGTSRFTTQPITIGEIRKASKFQLDTDAKLDKSDPCRLSISERIKLFSTTVKEENCSVPRPRWKRKTLPVTLEEVHSAKTLSSRMQIFTALEDSKIRIDDKLTPKVKDVPKKADNEREKYTGNLDGSDTAQDEGISSEEHDSGSEVDSDGKNMSVEKGSVEACLDSKFSERGTNKKLSGVCGEDSRLIEKNRFKNVTIRTKRNNENLIAKSKSQDIVQDENKAKNSEVRRSATTVKMPKSIAELQAKLQKSGDNDWRQRIPKLNNANEELDLLNVKNIYNEEKASILSARKDELDVASKQWKHRVEQSDAINFSVAGRMKQVTPDVPKFALNINDKSKRTPKAKTFKGKDGGDNGESESAPVSPDKKASEGFKRSLSLPGGGDTDSSTEGSPNLRSRKVKVERPDNVTFTNFYKSVTTSSRLQKTEVSVDDLDSIGSTGHLLVQKRTIQVQKRRKATKNPIKALAERTDVVDEYTEVLTGVAEREKQRLNVEKLAKNSNFAVEALAGLASKENFNSVALKRSSSINSNYPPYSDLMLLQVKGRRLVQTRLVEPIASSINEGDNFILITSNLVFYYEGAYANIIEKSRATDIVNSIQKTNDLGCKAEAVVKISSKSPIISSNEDVSKFWKLLGANNVTEIAPAGHPDEDEIYESLILSTNMIYEYSKEELIPVNQYWGTIPKIEMLSPFKIFIFDFGSELYVWSGKNAVLEDKKKALRLAREMWNEGYNYSECGINPIETSHLLGLRESSNLQWKNKERPKWALFAKITQHGETTLFKEKFLDWPDYSRVIQVKKSESDTSVNSKFDFQACDIKSLLPISHSEPDLVIDGIHLGRGKSYYDDETKRLFNFSTKKITCWTIFEYSHEEIEDNSVGQFYEGNSYIIRWEFMGNITGRELSGKPSKHMQAGKDYCVYFCWQGSKATVNEKGAAALLTITLDSENARQIRVTQGAEPPAFLRLFDGGMIVHRGKSDKITPENCRLFICRNEIESETFLIEVQCSMRSLRSKSSFLLINSLSNTIFVWNGSKASSESKKCAKAAAQRIMKNEPSEIKFSNNSDSITLIVVDEGSEDKRFINLLGGEEKRHFYHSLIKNIHSFDQSPRLFHLVSLSGTFEAIEMLCPYRNEYTTPYPFLQCDLYSANQPALFMLDDGYDIWLWQGWWPELDDDSNLIEQTGSAHIRYQEERKAAMQTAVDYCKSKEEDEKIPSAYLVWAGLEPLQFTNLFPSWEDNDEVTEINMQEGRKPGEAVAILKELHLLKRSTYPLEQLMQRPLPNGVDPVHLENYLQPDDFLSLMEMSLETFQKLPIWKQTALKKESGLF